jgi:GNAT superfamily N-acetyltransferase
LIARGEGDAVGGSGPATAAASATDAATTEATAAASALRRLVEDAAAGHFPATDGVTEFLPSRDGPVHAVLAFTAHHVVAADIDPGDAIAHLDPDDIAAPMGAPFLAWLGARLGAAPGTLDVVLTARAGFSAPPFPDELHEITPDAAHARIARALRYRTEVRAWESTDRNGILVLGRGLAGRWEASFEVSPDARGRGLGRTLAAVSMLAVPRGERVFLQVAPGNAASLRAALGAGFHPLGAEVLFLRDGRSPR